MVYLAIEGQIFLPLSHNHRFFLLLARDSVLQELNKIVQHFLRQIVIPIVSRHPRFFVNTIIQGTGQISLE